MKRGPITSLSGELLAVPCKVQFKGVKCKRGVSQTVPAEVLDFKHPSPSLAIIADEARSLSGCNPFELALILLYVCWVRHGPVCGLVQSEHLVKGNLCSPVQTLSYLRLVSLFQVNLQAHTPSKAALMVSWSAASFHSKV